MHKIYVCLVLLVFLLLAGCVNNAPPKPAGSGLAPDEMVSAEAVFTPASSLFSAEAVTREVTLTFFSEPVKVAPQTWVKLSGVVLGRERIALFTLATGSCAKKIGEVVGDYIVESIEKDCVVLKRGGVKL